MKTPEFQYPDKDLQFLASRREIFEYGNLYTFAKRLFNELDSVSITEQSPLLIFANQEDSTVLLIASCFLLRVPFLILHPDINNREAGPVFDQLMPGAVAGSPSQNHPQLSELKRIEVNTDLQNELSEWNKELFSFNENGEIACYILTSGSTSRPKIVPLKRRQFLFAADASAKNFRPEGNRYWLLCLPLNHVGGISVILRSLLYGSAIFRTAAFNTQQVRSFLAENPLFEAASLVPTMLMRVFEDPLFQPHKNLKAILIGGGPVSQELLRESELRGVPVVSSYGMTETCAQIAANPILNPSGIYTPKTSVGMVFKPNHIEIRDESGQLLPKNENGRIWLKGPQIFDGYLDSDLNNAVFDSTGWFDTGDYGHLNRNRQLFIRNRRTDLIVSGGENVNPEKVEKAILESSSIKDCAVTGIPDAEWGERVVAFVISENKKTDTDELRTMLQRRLLNHEVPKEIHFVDELPRSSLGKLQRGKLRRLYRTIIEGSK
ncbi:MAG: AMP-binding protein [Balneolaceae bacterium]|nr:AMP-binding protein [Balneolaceae bacterium]MCH8548663.1 AMP-binding protein [Balneolaceae bacterium]